VPVVIWAVIRLARAMYATARLLLDWKLMRAMPWGYIRTLPRRDPWIGIATVTLGGALLMVPTAIVLPGTAGVAAYEVGVFIAFVGLASSWIRYLFFRRS